MITRGAWEEHLDQIEALAHASLVKIYGENYDKVEKKDVKPENKTKKTRKGEKIS